jgi:D-sedoheptulose 7-phosphate isomerase
VEEVKDNLLRSAKAIETFAEKGSALVERAGKMIAEKLKAGGKVLACGNGGSASQAQHFSAELVGRFEKERRGFCAIALTTDTSILTAVANDYGYDTVFERQVRALGRKEDILLAISTSGNSPNVLKAIESAKEMGMTVIGLTGNGGGKMKGKVDILIDVPGDKTYRIQELHLAILHQLCAVVEGLLSDEVKLG